MGSVAETEQMKKTLNAERSTPNAQLSAFGSSGIAHWMFGVGR
jgi:hypothetical protein